ncbi:nitrate ABC transporter substrate-binding protein, partial [Halorubrum sp. E3]
MYERNAGASRRSFLAAAGGAATVGLAGCLGGGGGGGLDELTVAHMPIYPDLQWYVMEGEGYFSEIDAEVTGQEFGNGPDIVQALGGGDIDV